MLANEAAKAAAKDGGGAGAEQRVNLLTQLMREVYDRVQAVAAGLQATHGSGQAALAAAKLQQLFTESKQPTSTHYNGHSIMQQLQQEWQGAAAAAAAGVGSVGL